MGETRNSLTGGGGGLIANSLMGGGGGRLIANSLMGGGGGRERE